MLCVDGLRYDMVVNVQIFHFLAFIRSIIPDEVSSIKQLQSEHIYNIAATCLNAIDPERQLVVKLPSSKTAGFRMASAVANIIKEMGFNGEMGYQIFLYPNEASIRRLLSFLIDKVPRVDRAEEDRDTGSSNSLNNRVSAALSAFSQQKWTLLNNSARSTALAPFHACSLTIPTKSSNPDATAYFTQVQPWLTQQCSDRDMFPPSVFELGVRDVVLAEREARLLDSNVGARQKAFRDQLATTVNTSLRSALAETTTKTRTVDMTALRNKFSSAFSRKTDFTQEKTVVAQPGLSKEELDAKAREEYEALIAAREAELAALQSDLERIVSDGKQKKKDAENFLTTARQLENELTELNAKLAELENIYRIKKRVLDLLPNAQENIGKLQDLADSNASKLLSLNEEWERVRGELVEEYRTKKEALQARKDVIASKVELLRKMRAEMKERVAEIRQKDELYEQSVAELNSLPKSINRQVYVKRISDIVKNIDKQKEEIKKILEDVKSIQREINVKGESVKRSFDVADELIYQTAKVRRDPTAIQVYKNVVNLRSGFNHIIDTVETTGKVSNNIRELQQKIEQLEARNSSLNMDTVTSDLKQVKSDNSALKAQLKQLRASYADQDAE